MAEHIRAQIGWQVGSNLPRDVMQITPCFRAQADLDPAGTAYQDLADDLLDVIDTWTGAATRQITVKLYKIGEAKPNRPKATSVKYAGTNAEANCPRELAVCLSFNGGQNAPRQRGRLYLPAFLTANLATGVPVRPTLTIRDKVGALAPAFAALGGINIDWIVWSPTNSSATKVSNWFVDDEWDAQRRRGLKPTARSAGTTGG